jgi:catechol 2,3-dioxygenase-like lactoylglutathione lyase family enzyme
MSATLTGAAKFRVGLNVADLESAVTFYRTLFEVEPAKHFADYAEFEIADPPLVLALNPSSRTPGGALNHVGLRVASSEKLVAIQQRLEMAGVRTEREEGVECCYSRQTKFWVPDADRNLWEIYTLEEDLDHSGFGGEGQRMPSASKSKVDAVVWEHMITSPIPDRIPLHDGTVDEIHLEGTFNADARPEVLTQLLCEALRILKPGGEIAVHGLVCNQPFPGTPSLPGPAAMVRRIPVETEALDALAAAGFVLLDYEKMGDIHCFQAGGVELREMRLTGQKSFHDGRSADYEVLYKGPFAEVTDERNQQFLRGERVRVDGATWQLLSQPELAEHFACFELEPTRV